MKDKIEVGEYVRTKEGLIEKIKEFIPHYTKGKREGQEVEENYLLMGQEQCKFIESIDYRIPPCYPSDEEWEKIKKHIVNHSKQLIDLIEVGDIVNKELVIGIIDITNNKEEIIGRKLITQYRSVQFTGLDIKHYIYANDIKTILTKEQFETNCYKVGGKQWD